MHTDVASPTQRGNPALPLVVLGVGLGGLFDGIVLHQILQWHHMLSAHTPVDTVDGLRANTVADGLFHASTWLCTVAGLVLLVRELRGGAAVRWKGLFGGLLTGWGAFNVIEGLVDHYLLGLHHVRPGPDQMLYDGAFLVAGLAMTIVGIGLLRRTEDSPAGHRQSS
jgi:uncharacterized membrane protein